MAARCWLAILAVGFFTVALPAEEDNTESVPTGRAYLLKLSDRHQELEKTAEKAKKELLSALEDERKAARKRGDLDTAVALNDWIDELKGAKKTAEESSGSDTSEKPAPVDSPKAHSPLQGKYSFRYSNGITRVYSFGRDNTVLFLVDGVTANAHPVKIPVVWNREGDNLIGYIFWDDRKIHQIERIVVGKEGFVHIGHWSTNGVLTAEGTKIK